ncbi:hypothetical protein TCAL_14323 [Tigriopus californicus]|uniref:ISXO2-like transposase domain-containing protein n=1 Tax=Tigriopus californicus TaxID=6832 RepID=A0A553NEN8_TIGCA|nr:hypothetical protein TCAL_14323 [Tigriopus californicus]
MLAWLWSYKTSVSDTCSQTGVAAKAVGQWFSFYRDVCSHWLEENPYKIGGPGVIVEIDESVIAKRKYHRGRLVRERLKAMNGTSSDVLPSHLDEFMWREIHGRDGKDAFDNLLEHISEWYPV